MDHLDEVLGVVIPILVYWVYSGVYELLGSLEKYRLHSRREEDNHNLVSKFDVVKGVLLHQSLQVTIATLLFMVSSGEDAPHGSASDHETGRIPAMAMIAVQFVLGVLVVDTCQFFVHRFMHTNRILYRHVHSWHHRLVAPYGYGAAYMHPLEGLIMDTLPNALAFTVSGMTPRTAIFFFSFNTMKGIDDHSGLWLPVLRSCFWNKCAYHDIHHQLAGNRFNYSQASLVPWDHIFGTHMPYQVIRRSDGRFQAVPKVKNH